MGFDPVILIADWLRGLMTGWGFDQVLITAILKFIGAFVVGGLVMLIFIVQTWLERKVAGRIQDRFGPNRVGPFGLLQPIADAVKMVTKEDTTPANADKVAFNIAPILSVFSVVMIWAVLPFTATWFGADLNVGVLYIAAVGSFGVLAVLMAGWSSNNKYALFGAFRGVAMLVSYEVPMLLTLMVPVLLAGTMNVNEIVHAQPGFFNQFIFIVPLAFVLFFISNMAEIGRAPFDLLEAESEIVAGYNVEYSGMKFGLFQAFEFAHSFAAGAIISVFFFGGWQGPLVDTYPLLGLVYFYLKTFFFYWVIMWVRLTVPRIRIDQMMGMNWKFMVPTALVLLMLTPLLEYFVHGMGWIRNIAHLILNLVVGAAAVLIATLKRRPDRPERQAFPERPVAVPPKEEVSA
jgi:NADH-quinone oxidoreductase subunit H